MRAAIGAALTAALLLTLSCGGGSHRPPRATLGPATDADSAIRFEDLPVTRLPRDRVPQPNAANPSLGAPRAPVVIQIWSDFECPFCAETQPVLHELLKAYAGRVRLVWHDYPLPFHAHARLAANAGREAYEQGGASAFWKFHDAVYEAPEGELTASKLTELGSKAGLDSTRLQAALSTQRHEAEIAADVSSGNTVGVEGTPAFLVNDYFFVGSIPLEIMRVIVDRALSDVGG
ncbi:MAG: thioredoxin domain-containing protein [Polyangiaceae bacterium]